LPWIIAGAPSVAWPEGQVTKQELGLEDLAEVPIGPVKAILGRARGETFERD